VNAFLLALSEAEGTAQESIRQLTDDLSAQSKYLAEDTCKQEKLGRTRIVRGVYPELVEGIRDRQDPRS